MLTLCFSLLNTHALEYKELENEISETQFFKWTGIGELNTDDYYTYYCGQESLRRNGVVFIVNKRVQNA